MGRYRARDLLLVPTLLSLLRAPLAALFPLVVDRPWLALGVLLAAGLSDVLDGWWARRFHQTTAMGAVVDGITDKLFVGSVALSLLLTDRLPLFGLFLLGARDIGELPLVIWLASSRRQRRKQREQPAANVTGKLATVMQFMAVVVALFELPFLKPALVAAGVVGAVAAVVYWRRAIRVARGPETE